MEDIDRDMARWDLRKGYGAGWGPHYAAAGTAAAELVATHRAAILAVADALHRRGRLDGEEVAELVRAADSPGDPADGTPPHTTLAL